MLVVRHFKLGSRYGDVVTKTFFSDSKDSEIHIDVCDGVYGDSVFAIITSKSVLFISEGVQEALLPQEVLFSEKAEFKFVQSTKGDISILLIEIPKNFYGDEEHIISSLLKKRWLNLEEVIPFFKNTSAVPTYSDDFSFKSFVLSLAYYLPVLIDNGKSEKKENWLFEKIVRQIDANIGDADLYLVQIASLCFCSKRLVQKVLSAHGLTFSSMVNQRRLERFKYLLNYSNWHVSEISQKCGFNSVSYAIRLFRQENGITPHQYRKRLKENGGLKYNASGPRIYPSL